MVKRLDELPEELISNISARLHADDISAFRLTCRALEHKSLHEFGNGYFGEKCFMITTESLKVLVGIASSDKLKGYLHSIHFITALFTERAFKCPNGCNCTYKPSARQTDAFYTYIADQKSIMKSGRAKEMLLEAFKNLPTVTILTMTDSPAALPKDIDYRGRNKVPRVTGRLPTTSPDSFTNKEYCIFVHQVWKMIMDALIGSKISTLKKLATLLAKGAYALPISPDLALVTRSGMKSALANLDILLLTISTDGRFKSATSKTETETKYEGASTMKKLANMLPSLSTLDLTFDSGPSSGVFFTNLALNLDSTKMTRLFLQSTEIAAGSLNMVLSKFTSMKDLRLHLMNLTKGTWPAVLKAIQKLSHLKHLHLRYLLEGGQKAYFLKQKERGEGPSFDDWYDGPSDDDDMYDGEDSEDEDDMGDDTDDDMPPLESLDGLSTTANAYPSGAGIGEGSAADSVALPPHTEPTATLGQTNTTGVTIDPFDIGLPRAHDITEDFTAPGSPNTGERGYYICLQGDQIAALLPKFIAEYNVGEYVDDDFGPLPTGPGGFNNFLNMLGAAIGVAPPPPPPPPGAAGPGQGGGANPAPTNGPNGGAASATTGGTTPALNGGGQNGGAGGFATVLPNGTILGMGQLPQSAGGPGHGSAPWPTEPLSLTVPMAGVHGSNATTTATATTNGGAPNGGLPPLPPLVGGSGGSTAPWPVASSSPTAPTTSAQSGNAMTSSGTHSANLANFILDDDSSMWEDEDEEEDEDEDEDEDEETD